VPSLGHPSTSTPTFAVPPQPTRSRATCCSSWQLRPLGEPWAADDGFLLHGKRIYVPAADDLRHQVVALAHSAGMRGSRKPSCVSERTSTSPATAS
jgi:hypothetical protein